MSFLLSSGKEKMTREELTRHLIDMSSTLHRHSAEIGRLVERVLKLEKQINDGVVLYRMVDTTPVQGKTWSPGWPCPKCGKC
jgi:hypothetical protein